MSSLHIVVVALLPLTKVIDVDLFWTLAECGSSLKAEDKPQCLCLTNLNQRLILAPPSINFTPQVFDLELQLSSI